MIQSGVTKDKHGNSLSPCPDCGALKLKRSARCRPCSARAQIGVPKTDTPGEPASRARARQICPPGECTYDGCQKDGAHVHHIDGNPFNNDPANLTRLCPRHHMVVDGRLEAARARAALVGRLYGGRPPKEQAA